MSKPLHNEQLLSAYLDGEVTEKERSAAERLLENDPNFRSLLSQWRELGETLRALPAAHAPVDLADRVLSRVLLPGDRMSVTDGAANWERIQTNPHDNLLHERGLDQQVEALAESGLPGQGSGESVVRGSAGASSVWRGRVKLGMVSLVSMAAGLLLALMFFPRYDQEAPPVAASSSPSFSVQLSDSPDAGGDGHLEGVGMARVAGIDRQLPVPPSSALIPQPGEQGEDSFHAAKSNDLAAAQPELADAAISQLMATRSRGEGELANSQSRSLFAGEARVEAGLAEADLAVPPAVAPTLAVSDGKKLDDSTDTFSSYDYLDASPIEQLYFVDFKTDDPPLAVVSEVFTSNGIVILSDPVKPFNEQTDSQLAGREKSDGQGSLESGKIGQLKVEALNRLQEYSSGGVEAVYVVATKAQLDNAIEQLSDRANVSGFHLPPGLAASLLAEEEEGKGVEEGQFPHGFQPMEQLIAEERVTDDGRSGGGRSLIPQNSQAAGEGRSTQGQLGISGLGGLGGIGGGGRAGEGVFHLEQIAPAPSRQPSTIPPGKILLMEEGGRFYNPYDAPTRTTAKAQQLQPFNSSNSGNPSADSSDNSKAGTEASAEQSAVDESSDRLQQATVGNEDSDSIVKFLLLIKTRSRLPD